MPLFQSKDRQTIESLAALTYCNPFDPEFIEQERSILGSDYVPHGTVWSLGEDNPAVEQLAAISERVARDTRERLLRLGSATTDELTLYAYIVAYTLYLRYADELHQIHLDPQAWPAPPEVLPTLPPRPAALSRD